MKIVYLSNIFHHLQKPLAEELYRLTNGEYVFVETAAMEEGMAYKTEKAPYVVQYHEGNKKEIEQMVFDADVVLYGQAPMSLVKRRFNSGRLTFSDDERRYKHINRYLKWPIYTFRSLTFNKGYLLCANAYGARDYSFSGMSLKKCFKWGYFPAIKEYNNIEDVLDSKRFEKDGIIQLFWTGRLINVKHPESTIYLAKRLKDQGCNFEISIAGDGPLKKKLLSGIEKYNLSDCVKLLGLQQPETVRNLMEKSDIYLFTSDRGEGWGAVLNESMNSACAVVASPASGSAPFLIKENENGLFFEDKNWDDLYNKVIWLIEHREERRKMGREAYFTMLNVWSPKIAAQNLITLVNSLQKGEDIDISEGPCSKASYLPQNWR